MVDSQHRRSSTHINISVYFTKYVSSIHIAINLKMCKTWRIYTPSMSMFMKGTSKFPVIFPHKITRNSHTIWSWSHEIRHFKCRMILTLSLLPKLMRISDWEDLFWRYYKFWFPVYSQDAKMTFPMWLFVQVFPKCSFQSFSPQCTYWNFQLDLKLL